MDLSTCWAIRPDVLRAITQAINSGPSRVLCERAAPIFGEVPTSAELRSAIVEDMATRGEAFADLVTEAGESVEAARPTRTTTAGGMAVIPLHGVIQPRASLLAMIFGLGGGLNVFRQQLRSAVADDDIGSILIDVNSPGGIIDLIPETAAEIREAGKVKPIRAIANTDAGSAAYWLAAQASELIVSPSGSVGSVGVFIQHNDWSAWNEKQGIDPTFIFAGKYKVEGNAEEPLSDEARDAFQARVDTYYEMFVSDVAKGRGATPAGVRKGFGEGRMVLARDAVAAGMADRVESFEAARARLTGKRRSASADEVLEERPQSKSNERERLLAVQLARPRHA